MKWITLSLVLLICYSGFSQATTPLDTLTEKVESIRKNENMNAVFDYLNTVIEFHQNSGSNIELGKALRLKGRMQMNLRTYPAYQEAEKTLLAAEHALEKANYKLGLYKCYQALGIIRRKIGTYDEAIGYFQQSLKNARIFTRTLDSITYELGTAYRWLGTTYNRLEELDTSLYYLEKSYETMLKVPNNECPNLYIFESLLNLASTENKASLLIQAENHINKAIEFAERDECLKRYRLLLYGIQGSIFNKQNLDEKVIENYDNALRLARELGLKERESEILNSYGHFYYKK